MVSTAPPTHQPLEKSRVGWVDHAKGICIFFVVMFHVNDVAMEQRGGMPGWLSHVVEFARPFRMPDFFLIAGLFLSASMRRPWRSYLDGKVIHFFYFYALWMTSNFAIFNVSHSLLDTNDSAIDIMACKPKSFPEIESRAPRHCRSCR